MRSAIVVWRTAVRIVLADRYVVVIHMIAVHVMEMPIVKIIGVAIVFHSGMTAICAMLMGVAFVFGTSGHDALHLASSAGRFASSTVHGLIRNAYRKRNPLTPARRLRSYSSRLCACVGRW